MADVLQRCSYSSSFGVTNLVKLHALLLATHFHDGSADRKVITIMGHVLQTHSKTLWRIKRRTWNRPKPPTFSRAWSVVSAILSKGNKGVFAVWAKLAALIIKQATKIRIVLHGTDFLCHWRYLSVKSQTSQNKFIKFSIWRKQIDRNPIARSLPYCWKQPAAWAHKIVNNLTNYTCVVRVLTCITGLSRQRNWYD